VNRLVRLYPRAWRERYLAEFTDLLEDRPPVLRDDVDIVRGALDAWIHPQVSNRPSDEPANDQDRRRAAAGAFSIIGGGLWIVAGVVMRSTEFNSALGYKDASAASLILVGAMLVTALAAFALAPSASSPRAVPGAAAGLLIGAVLTAMPWPVLIVGFFAYVLSTAAFGVLLRGAARQPAGGLLAICALILVNFNTEDDRALLTIPIGLAWIAIGALAARRAPAATVA
jgi:hypothetical protein